MTAKRLWTIAGIAGIAGLTAIGSALAAVPAPAGAENAAASPGPALSRLGPVKSPSADTVGLERTNEDWIRLPLAPRPAAHKPAGRKIGEPEPLFAFAVIGDAHVRYDGGVDSRYLKDMEDAVALLAAYAEDINAHDPPIDFTVQLGDITDLGRPDEFVRAKEALAGLACPLHAVIGNHDNFKNDHKRAWFDFAGVESSNYTFEVKGFRFIVIDCTLDPYAPPYVECAPALRKWVAEELAANPDEPTIVFSHFNMWKRPWNPMFDTTLVYEEYRGMPELRQVLEEAGNVVAVINGHVHANSVECHNGIYYIDVAATLIGPPSIRYFRVFEDRIEASSEYISDRELSDRVTALCTECTNCFDPNKVCAFVEGRDSDREFMMPVRLLPHVPPPPVDSLPAGSVALSLTRDQAGHVLAVVSSRLVGPVEITVSDVLGRRMGRCSTWKDAPDLTTDLSATIPRVDDLPPGMYFVRVSIRGATATQKLALVQ